MTKTPKKLVPVTALNNAVTALEVAYGVVHSHLKWNNRPTIGDSHLQQISAALNGLGAKTPKLEPVTAQYPCKIHDGCTMQCGDPHLYCTGYCSH